MLRRGQSLLKLDSKPGQCSLPVSERHCPFFGYVGQSQVEQFEQGIITGKRAPILGDLAQTHVHRLNGAGRVNDAPYLRRVIKERGNSRPVAAPGFHNGGVVRAPLALKLLQPNVSLGCCGRGVDGLEIRSDHLAQFPAHIVQAVAHHVHQAHP